MRTTAALGTLPVQRTSSHFARVKHSNSDLCPRDACSIVARVGGMGIGFTSEDEGSFVDEGKIVSPKYGLSVQQMHVLGLTPEGLTKIPQVESVRGLASEAALITFLFDAPVPDVL